MSNTDNAKAGNLTGKALIAVEGRSVSKPTLSPTAPGSSSVDVDDQEAVTCSVLCSLMNSSTAEPPISTFMISNSCETSSQTSVSELITADSKKRRIDEVGTDQLQLPMFLSSKFVTQLYGTYIYAR